MLKSEAKTRLATDVRYIRCYGKLFYNKYSFFVTSTDRVIMCNTFIVIGVILSSRSRSLCSCRFTTLLRLTIQYNNRIISMASFFLGYPVLCLMNLYKNFIQRLHACTSKWLQSISDCFTARACELRWEIGNYIPNFQIW